MFVLQGMNSHLIPRQMDKLEKVRELDAVRSLPFVSYITVHEKGELIVVGLAPTLTQYLPENRRAINFARIDFSLANVVEAYRHLIVDYLKDAVTLVEAVLADSNHRLNALVLR